MSRADRMRQILETAFQPSLLNLIDDSMKHQGHRGWREGGETHYNLEIKAESLSRLPRVQAQQAIYRVLKSEFETGLHALSIRVIV
ncbi:MAG: BolA family transcriptional regulator [Alphaproteobacteria bacterium]|nr:MAG: BolA family transcriptional regulator [Alphaproteobacteria bacterium]